MHQLPLSSHKKDRLWIASHWQGAQNGVNAESGYSFFTVRKKEGIFFKDLRDFFHTSLTGRPGKKSLLLVTYDGIQDGVDAKASCKLLAVRKNGIG